MADHASAKKRIRRNARRSDINISRLSRIRTFLKKVDVAISEGNSEGAKEALKQVQPELQRGAAKGLFHKNSVARKLSRLSAKIKAL